MTASSSGGNTCLTAKGLDISLAALQRQDPYINNIVDVASQVALYTFNNRSNEWEKTDVEGTLFVYTRLASPRHGFTIMNRLNMENLTEPITKDLDFQLQDPFLLYRNARLAIYGIWFYDKADCQRIAELMKNLTKQEQALAQLGQQAQGQGGLVSPRALEAAGDPGKGQGVDILQMLTKARNEYDKGGNPEPKEIGGCNVLDDNPNLIKPIPVKPMERYPQAVLQERPVQDSQGEPRPLSLATLFGVQQPRPELVSPMAGSGSGGPGSQPQGKPGGVRPAVARSLSYEDPVQAQLQAQEGVLISGSSPPQHCPAFQKLMRDASSFSSQPQNQLQRGGPMELLQPVSESPENGAPSALQHHQQIQARQDPIQRLFQNHPTSTTPSMASSTPCCSHPLLLSSLASSLPILSLSWWMLWASLVLNTITTTLTSTSPLTRPSRCTSDPPSPPDAGPLAALTPLPVSASPPNPAWPSSTSITALSPFPLLPATPVPPPALSPPTPARSPPAGAANWCRLPHELLQRLQLVQQEQSLVPEPTRPSSNLAPASTSQPPAMGQHGQQSAHSTARSLDSWADMNSAGTAAQKFQVISPKRIPATVAPTLLLSPSVFSQAKRPQPKAPGDPHCSPGPHPPSALMAPQAPEDPHPRGLSKNQLQATLLHLIQNDSSFLDTIYECYAHRFSAEATANKF